MLQKFVSRETNMLLKRLFHHVKPWLDASGKDAFCVTKINGLH